MRRGAVRRLRDFAVTALLLAVMVFVASPDPLLSAPAEAGDHHAAEVAESGGTHPAERAPVPEHPPSDHCHPGIDCFAPTILAPALRLDAASAAMVSVTFLPLRARASGRWLGSDPPPPRG